MKLGKTFLAVLFSIAITYSAVFPLYIMKELPGLAPYLTASSVTGVICSMIGLYWVLTPVEARTSNEEREEE